ncbi:unnamed protein product [Rotaria socialis]|uniref:Proteasome activator Blm10 mid region domain-containing protein n=1 Tax=Rotaria socialis TaxID=392032 RepID=A0A820IXE5_9BILA|nr:unnamed protein product [Rotaria socialis]
MDDPIESERSTDIDEMDISEDNLQKPNIFNKYLPFYDSVKRQGYDSLDEIRENLSRIIQLRELRPGFSHWSSKLQRFMSHYGLYFTKIDHIKIINLYVAVLTIEDLDFSHVKTCFDMLYDLTRKTRLITRDDLVVDWRLLHKWAKVILHNHDESYSLVSVPNDIESSLFYCIRGCRPYFAESATQEILDEFRPYLCPFDSAFSDTMRIFELFLPVHLPLNLHEKGFKLWLPEFLGIWESIYSNPGWELNMVNLFSLLAWCNIGYIDWEPWLPRIFTRILKSFSLPVGKLQVSLQQYHYSMSSVTTWIVAMLGNGSSCLQHLQDLFTAIKNFYHPSNSGKFQQDLISFLSKLAQAFVDRVHLERKANPVWYFTPPDAYRLTEQDITDFVNCVKECAFIAIFTKAYLKEAAKACQYLSMLRPELIVPPLVEKLFSSIDSMSEPHRFTSIMTCLASLARQIVRQAPHFSQGQTYVLPLLMAVLPGIDSNDFKKTAVTFQFLNAILMLVTCIDCSSAIHTRNDLTEAWGQHVEFDKLNVQFHIPNEDEVDFACEFVETFIYPELQLLNEKCSKMSTEERLRSLTLVHYMSIGCLRMVPRIDSKLIDNLVPSVAPYGSKYQTQYSIYAKQPQFKENLRMRLLIDVGKLIDVIVENHSDDASSIKIALKIYSLSSIYYGVFKHDADKLHKHFEAAKGSFINKLYGERQYPRFLMIERITLQCERFSLTNFQSLTEIDKQVILKLFELSIHRYSEVRRDAQGYLFSVLNRYLFSYQVIVDRIIELLNSPSDIDHDQIKGCLYILLGNHSFFLPTKHSWSMIERLWPAMARTTHAKKPTTQRLMDHINETIGKQFDTQALVEDTNDVSRKAAVDIWKPLDPVDLESRDQIRQQRNEENVQSYNNLMETLNSLLRGDSLTWRQQETTMSLMWLLLQKRVPIPSSCIRTFVDFLVHDNVELRKISEEGITAFSRLQKPARIYVEKTLGEILQRPVDVEECRPGDRDDNLWVTIDNYKPAKTQKEWEETCFLDKSYHGYYKWPKTIKYTMNKRERYTKDNMPEDVAFIYDRFMDTNFISKFTQFMVLDEEKGKISFDTRRFHMFKGLFRNYGLAFVDNFMERLYVLVHEKTKEKQEGSHRVAAEIVAGMIRGSKYWTIEMLDELWLKLTPFLNEVCANLGPETLSYWASCFKLGLEDEDPRRMHRPINYLRSLINTTATGNTFMETSRWYLVQTLTNLEWRVPSIWCMINEQAKELLDHPYKAIRERIAIILSSSLTFDVTLVNGQSTRHPNANKFLDAIRERLGHAIEIYEKTPLANVSGQTVEIDPEARKALNFIETGQY